MKNLRAAIAVAFAKLIGVNVKVREDFFRPDWLGENVGPQPSHTGGLGVDGCPPRA